jgi:hypothetical protein
MKTRNDRETTELHDDAPKRVTTLGAAAVETKWSRVFTRSSGMGR